jgi:3-hydroxyisobutyrate dehydrogenase-like beta-hydroxyacid dehydrogenase
VDRAVPLNAAPERSQQRRAVHGKNRIHRARNHGHPHGGHLIAGGHSLFAYSRRNIPASLLERGATACESSEEVAKASDIVFIMVPDTPDVEEVLFGASGVARGLAPGKIVVDMSSISPLATKDFAKRVNDLGCQYLDAPVSGGEVGAKAGSLTVSLPNTATAQQLFNACAAHGGAKWDHSALVRSLEIMANHEIGRSP